MSTEPAKPAVTAVQHRLPLLLRSLLMPALVSSIGFAATIRGLRDWYPTLEKPAWNPPNGVFGPVWTTLYLMMGIADSIIAARTGDVEVSNARRLNRLQLVLNGSWSVFFFGFRKPGWALVDIVALWAAVAMTIAAFWRISRVAGLLLVPYLLWITFAAVLNANIWLKNRQP